MHYASNCPSLARNCTPPPLTPVHNGLLSKEHRVVGIVGGSAYSAYLAVTVRTFAAKGSVQGASSIRLAISMIFPVLALTVAGSDIRARRITRPSNPKTNHRT